MGTPIPQNHASFTLAEVAEATGGRLVGDGSLVVFGVFTDSRQPQEEGLFVALEGARFDGHAYAETVPARALLVRKEDACGDRPRVVVEDTLEALGALAQFHRMRFGIPVIGLTGSVGKTTTKQMVCAALEATGAKVCATEGNLNNLIGLPMSLLTMASGHTHGVFEMGTNAPGEIEALAGMALPDVAIITAVRVAHTEGLGSLEAIAEEKGALLSVLDEEDQAVLCADDVLLTSIPCAAPVTTFGESTDADVRIELGGFVLNDVTAGEMAAGDGVPGRNAVYREVTVRVGERALALKLMHLGRGGALAVGAALTVLHVLTQGPRESDRGDMADVLMALSAVEAGAGRMGATMDGAGTLILDDSYNASPSSVAACLRDGAALAEARGGRFVAVLGDMGELGDETENAHREALRLAADLGASVVGVGERYAQAHSEQPDLSSAYQQATDAADAAQKVKAMGLGEGDVVAAKGSRFMGLEETVALLLGSAVHGSAADGKNTSPGGTLG